MPMRALIAGGGVCGPAAALALQRAGIEAVVYEARPSLWLAEGSYLSIATNGLNALHAIAADAAVLETAFPTTRAVLFGGSGVRLGTVPIGSTRAAGSVSHTIRRVDLHRALHTEAVARGVRIEFGKRLTGAAVTAEGVRAHFDDGSEATGDLLVGCDGVHSITRTIIDRNAPRPRYVGLLNFGGYTAGISVGEPGAWHMIFGARAFFGYVPDNSGGTAWFANVPRQQSTRDERAATTDAEWQRRLMELFADDRGPALDLIGAGRLHLAADNTHDLPHVPVWHRGPVIVIGDAAHAPSPSSGQGASMALEDAVILAKCLRDVPGSGRAFAVFERLRRDRVERIVRHGARSSSSKAAGPIGRAVRDLLLPLVFRYGVTERSLAWMYEHRVDWDRLVAS
jgi:2-polyprenyl-6-methoxyphenol hydroxylase-like FAD-dependent oxidoreductase